MSDYYKDKSLKDGHCSKCKSCKRIYNKQWYEDNKEVFLRKYLDYKRKHNEYYKNYRQTENYKNSRKKYLLSPKGRENKKRIRSKYKRNLGFIPVNEQYDGSVAHHLDDNHIMYIPDNIHKRWNYPDREIHRLLVLNDLYVKDYIL